MARTQLNPGRLAAAHSLLGVNNGGHADKLLAKYAPPSGQDRRLAWHICLGILRHRRSIDATIQPLIERPLAELDHEVLCALRIGVFEFQFSRTKRHAVVDQAVELVKELGCAKAKGFVNAILRRIPTDTDHTRGEQLNHPDWILERWDKRYSSEAVDRWCTANNAPPELYIVLKAPNAEMIANWEAQGVDVAPATFAGNPIENMYHINTNGQPIDTLDGYHRGNFWVQDIASVLSSDLIGTTSNMRILDACAAPGGKTMRLASSGAAVTAVDESSKRLRRLRQNLSRVNLTVDIVRHDWTKGALSERKWDAVLVDAPCTGIGTLRRHPEIRWRRTPFDLLRLAPTQAQILAGASQHVRKGGLLVYSVCSPEPEEGRNQIQAFLENNGAFRLDVEKETAPPEGDYDAFYMARLVRE